MANFPASLDALANPTATTLRNETGFELHAVISNLNDIVEALEAKLGIGASAPGASAAVLRRSAAGASAWGQVATADLAANAATKASIVPFLGGSSGSPAAYPLLGTVTTIFLGGDCLFFAALPLQHGTLGATLELALQIDGAAPIPLSQGQAPAVNYQIAGSGLYGTTLTAASHAINFLVHSNTNSAMSWAAGYGLILERIR